MGVIVPIVDIAAQYDKALLGRVFKGELFDIFEGSPGYQPDEDFTFTFRLSLDLNSEDGQAERERICTELWARYPEEAKNVIATLDENSWDVSFFADFF